MNDELQKTIVKLLTKAANGMDCVGRQIPEIVNELLLWNFWESLLWFIGRFVVLGLLLVFAYFSWDTKNDEGIPFGKIISGAFFIIWSISLLAACCSHGTGLDWLQIWIAPKSWILEYALSLK